MRIKQMIKQLFCKHDYQAKTPVIPKSKAYCQYVACSRCGKVKCEVWNAKSNI